MSINHRRISLSIASGLLLEVINKISPLLILYHAQKSLGLTDFGWAQYQLALFESVQPLVTYGFANYALAEASAQDNAKNEWQHLFSHIFFLKLTNAVLVILFFGAMHFFTPGQHSSLDILIVVLFSSVIDAYWLCIYRHKLAILSLVSGLLRVSSLVLILMFIRDAEDKHLFVLLSLLPNAAISLGTGIYAYRELAFAPVVFSRLKQLFLKATPFALIILIVTILDRMDIFLVEKWFGLTTAGIYAGPAKIVQSLAMIISSLALPFYAEILRVHDRQDLYKHVALSLWFLSALIAPIIFGLPNIEPEVIKLIFTNLPNSVDYLVSILSVGMIGTVLLSVFGLQILMSKSRPWPIISGGALFVFVVPVLVWMTKDSLGFKAAAYSIVVGKIGLGIYCGYFAKDFVPKIPWISLLKPLLAGMGMGLILYMSHVEQIAAKILLGGLVYVALLALTNFAEFKAILQHPKIKKIVNFKGE